jgi:phosphoribulokinase
LSAQEIASLPLLQVAGEAGFGITTKAKTASELFKELSKHVVLITADNPDIRP